MLALDVLQGIEMIKNFHRATTDGNKSFTDACAEFYARRVPYPGRGTHEVLNLTEQVDDYFGKATDREEASNADTCAGDIRLTAAIKKILVAKPECKMAAAEAYSILCLRRERPHANGGRRSVWWTNWWTKI